jgi:LacI family transcriptional regulator
MAKQVKIKDIALMSGVSAGTVDRIIHNRGNVSESSRQAVEAVMKKINYRTNIHTSAISIKKTYKLTVVMPTATEGEYWGYILEGIDKALAEFSDLNLKTEFVYYNQFDVYSCSVLFDQVIEAEQDAVIIGPTFVEETKKLCSALDKKRIPYVFVDSVIEGTSPIAAYSINQHDCGRLLAESLSLIIPKGSPFVVFRSKRLGNLSANNSVSRFEGFKEYLDGDVDSHKLSTVPISMLEPDANAVAVKKLLAEHPDLQGAVVLNSRGYVVSQLLEKLSQKKIHVICFDYTLNNVKELRKGNIDILLCQHPQTQGFLAVNTVIRYLVYGEKTSRSHYLPIDIVMRENVDYYQDMISF